MLLGAELDSACWSKPTETPWLLQKTSSAFKYKVRALSLWKHMTKKYQHVATTWESCGRRWGLTEAEELTQEWEQAIWLLLKPRRVSLWSFKQGGSFSNIVIWKKRKRMGMIDQILIWLLLVKLHRPCWIYIRDASDLHLFKFTSNVPFEPRNLENLGAFDAIPKQYKGEPVLIGAASLAFNTTLKRWQRAVADLSFLSMLPGLW